MKPMTVLTNLTEEQYAALRALANAADDVCDAARRRLCSANDLAQIQADVWLAQAIKRFDEAKAKVVK